MGGFGDSAKSTGFDFLCFILLGLFILFGIAAIVMLVLNFPDKFMIGLVGFLAIICLFFGIVSCKQSKKP
jgi:hypothetical protein